jgi:hypothetical protein
VRVEHSLAGVKRARVLKETLRNYKANFSDLVAACTIYGCANVSDVCVNCEPKSYYE